MAELTTAVAAAAASAVAVDGGMYSSAPTFRDDDFPCPPLPPLAAPRRSPSPPFIANSAAVPDERRERMMLSLAASSSSLATTAAAAAAASVVAHAEEESLRRRARERGAMARRAAERALRKAADGSELLSFDSKDDEDDDDDDEKIEDTEKIRKREKSASPTVGEHRPSLRALLDPSVPLVPRSDVCVGDLLGRGGFSDVFEVKSLGGAAEAKAKAEATASSSVAAAAAAAVAALALNEEKEEEEGKEHGREEGEDLLNKCGVLEKSFSDMPDEGRSPLIATAPPSPSHNHRDGAAAARSFPNRRSSAAAAEKRRRSSAITSARRSSAVATSASEAATSINARSSRRGSTASLRKSFLTLRRRSSAATRRRSSAATSLSLQDVFHEHGNENRNENSCSYHSGSDSKRRSFNGSFRDMAMRCVEVVTMCSRRASSIGGGDEFLDDMNDDAAEAPKYALKQLSSDTWTGDYDALQNGAADLVLEAAYLSTLRHRNLIELHGVAEGGCEAFEEWGSMTSMPLSPGSSSSSVFDSATTSSCFMMPPRSPSPPARMMEVPRQPTPFFLILDRLHCTLGVKIRGEWSDRMNQQRRRGMIAAAKGGGSRRRLLAMAKEHSLSQRKLLGEHGDADAAASFLAERLGVARDVASALTYLHRRNVLHRDVKPDNVGFDNMGNVKLFDLGLAKELKQSRLATPDDVSVPPLYNLTGRTGSRSYMSPEVALSRPYGTPADVYSFSILLWEVCSLRRAYGNMSASDHERCVVRGYVRPDSPELHGVNNDGNDGGDESIWSDELKCLMGLGWDPESVVRPTMEEVGDSLAEEVRRLGGAAAAVSGFEDGCELAKSVSSSSSSAGSPPTVRRVTRSALAA